MSLEDINNTIKELENGETTFASCQKLASLYIVRDGLCKDKSNQDLTIKEYKDILPSYNSYKDSRVRYARGEVTCDMVDHELSLLCIELKEFIQAIYQGTNNDSQRQILLDMIRQIG